VYSTMLEKNLTVRTYFSLKNGKFAMPLARGRDEDKLFCNPFYKRDIVKVFVEAVDLTYT